VPPSEVRDRAVQRNCLSPGGSGSTMEESKQAAGAPPSNRLELEALKRTGFAAEASPSSGPIEVRMSGNADSSVLAALEHFLRGLHSEACRLGTSEVRVDIRELYFMNSSCLKLFVTWFTQLRELNPAQQYRVIVSSSPQLHWQARSFDALRYIANG